MAVWKDEQGNTHVGVRDEAKATKTTTSKPKASPATKAKE